MQYKDMQFYMVLLIYSCVPAKEEKQKEREGHTSHVVL